MRTKMFGLFLGLATLAATTAQAQLRPLEARNFGRWDYKAFTSDGRDVAACSIGTYWNSGRQLRITALAAPRALVLSVEDPTWSMRYGSSGMGALVIDGERFTAEFSASSGTMALVQISNPEAGARFLRAFSDGYIMTMQLPWGQSVQAGLGGTTEAITALNGCVGRI
ncbi:MAG: hypothetical protein ACOYOH_07670 [Paracraurococcus sp.]